MYEQEESSGTGTRHHQRHHDRPWKVILWRRAAKAGGDEQVIAAHIPLREALTAEAQVFTDTNAFLAETRWADERKKR
jgi:hypothetical protein